MPINNEEIDELIEEVGNQLAIIPPTVVVESIYKELSHLLSDETIAFFSTPNMKQMIIMEKDIPIGRLAYLSITTQSRSEGAYLMCGALNRLSSEYKALGCLAPLSQMALAVISIKPPSIATFAMIGFKNGDINEMYGDPFFSQFLTDEGSVGNDKITQIQFDKSDIVDKTLLALDKREIRGS